MSEDFYSILGLSNDCSDEDIRRTYRMLAMKHHPDKNMKKTASERQSAEEIFKTINLAYETLGDPVKRKRYDNDIAFDQIWTLLCDVFCPIQSVVEGFGLLMFNIFTIPLTAISWAWTWTLSFKEPSDEQFKEPSDEQFKEPSDESFNEPNGVKLKGEPIYVDLFVELEELYNGTVVEMKHQRRNHIDDVLSQTTETTETKEIKINVMPGWREGTRITFNNYGDVLKDTNIEPSDVIYVVKQKPHTRFKRIENDLVTMIDLTCFEATSCFEKSITSIDNKQINISVRGGINDSDTTYKIIGKGMPIRKQGNHIGYGDLLVKFIVHFKTQDISKSVESDQLNDNMVYTIKLIQPI